MEQLQAFQLVDPNEIPAQQGLDVVPLDLVGGPGLKHQLLIDPVEDPILPGVLEQEQQACVGGEMTGGEFDTIDHGWILSYRNVC